MFDDFFVKFSLRFFSEKKIFYSENFLSGFLRKINCNSVEEFPFSLSTTIFFRTFCQKIVRVDMNFSLPNAHLSLS